MYIWSMKSAEEVLVETSGLMPETIKQSYPWAIKAMELYAAQFMTFKDCYNCNGHGSVPEFSDYKCVICQGNGKLLILPALTNTGT